MKIKVLGNYLKGKVFPYAPTSLVATLSAGSNAARNARYFD